VSLVSLAFLAWSALVSLAFLAWSALVLVLPLQR